MSVNVTDFFFVKFIIKLMPTNRFKRLLFVEFVSVVVIIVLLLLIAKAVSDFDLTVCSSSCIKAANNVYDRGRLFSEFV